MARGSWSCIRAFAAAPRTSRSGSCSLAISGDLLAIQEIFNRVDGRVTAARGNEEVGPAITEMVVRWMTLQEAEAAQAAMPILDLAPLPAPGENEST